MERLGIPPTQIKVVTRRLRRVHRGVYASGDLDEFGWLHAAVLTMGPGAALSHLSALHVLGLCEALPDQIHVTVPRGGGRAGRDGIVVHRRRVFERCRVFGIPTTTPSQTLKDAKLPAHELYHALDRADVRGYAVTLPSSAVSKLREAVDGLTRSAAEARFLLLCHDRGWPLPLVNHRLHGFETDFHWPHTRLVVEVDGYEFHKERPQFEEDRRRGLVHNAHGYTVTRVSATHVEHHPELIAAALAVPLSAPRRKGRAGAVDHRGSPAVSAGWPRAR